MLPFPSSPTAGAHLAFIDGLGGAEMLLIFVIVLMLFGGDKLPEFARGLGKTMREFKKAASGVEEEFRRAMEEDERKRAAAATPTLPAGTSTPAPSGYPEDGAAEYAGEPDPATLAHSTTTPATSGRTNWSHGTGRTLRTSNSRISSCASSTGRTSCAISAIFTRCSGRTR